MRDELPSEKKGVAHDRRARWSAVPFQRMGIEMRGKKKKLIAAKIGEEKINE